MARDVKTVLMINSSSDMMEMTRTTGKGLPRDKEINNIFCITLLIKRELTYRYKNERAYGPQVIYYRAFISISTAVKISLIG